MEIIDSTNLKVLSEVEGIDEEIDGNYIYYIGVLNENVLIRMHSPVTNNRLITFLYERVNHFELIKQIEDVYAGKLPELNIEHFTIKRGKDFLVIGINSIFPHTSFKAIEKFKLTNNRTAVIDERERDVWNFYMSIEMGKLMLEEMKRIKDQVVSYK